MGEGFGQELDIQNGWYDYETQYLEGIYGAQAQTVLFKPLSGLLNQPKYIPLRYCPLTFELELVNDPLEPIVHSVATSFTVHNISILWQIENVQVKVDLCTLDNELENTYAKHALSGGSFPINYNTYISQSQSIIGTGGNGQKDIQLSISRAVMRLKSLFITLFKENANEDIQGRREWNTFYSPMHSYATGAQYGFRYDQKGEFECYVQIGSKLFPEYPIRSHAEAFYQLKKSIGIQASPLHSIDIRKQEYRNVKMII
jgi:hypothetical protein